MLGFIDRYFAIRAVHKYIEKAQPYDSYTDFGRSLEKFLVVGSKVEIEVFTNLRGSQLIELSKEGERLAEWVRGPGWLFGYGDVSFHCEPEVLFEYFP